MLKYVGLGGARDYLNFFEYLNYVICGNVFHFNEVYIRREREREAKLGSPRGPVLFYGRYIMLNGSLQCILFLKILSVILI